MKRFWLDMNPTVRGFIIILAITGVVVALSLYSTARRPLRDRAHRLLHRDRRFLFLVWRERARRDLTLVGAGEDGLLRRRDPDRDQISAFSSGAVFTASTRSRSSSSSRSGSSRCGASGRTSTATVSSDGRRRGQARTRFRADERLRRAGQASDFRGKPVVLYFYPKSDTPGCAAQACGIRDSFAEFEQAGAVVLGVSSDKEAAQAKFKSKYELPFTILADPDHVAGKAYGVEKEDSPYFQRSTFLIDSEGNVAKIMLNVDARARRPGPRGASR